MKTREEKIEEMAKAMCGEYGTDTCNECSAQCFCANKNIAENLYAAGYRKQSDTAREFVGKLKKALFAKCTYILAVSDPNEYDMKSRDVIASIDELAKEYGAEVEE